MRSPGQEGGSGLGCLFIEPMKCQRHLKGPNNANPLHTHHYPVMCQARGSTEGLTHESRHWAVCREGKSASRGPGHKTLTSCWSGRAEGGLSGRGPFAVGTGDDLELDCLWTRRGKAVPSPGNSAEGGTSAGNGALGCLGQSVGGKCMEGGAAGWRAGEVRRQGGWPTPFSTRPA